MRRAYGRVWRRGRVDVPQSLLLLITGILNVAAQKQVFGTTQLPSSRIPREPVAPGGEGARSEPGSRWAVVEGPAGVSARRKKPRHRAGGDRSAPAPRQGWDIEFFQRIDKKAQPRVPARSFLDDCPTEVRAELLATLQAVRDAPPPAFSGGLRWHAMHGDMSGWFEARTKQERSRGRPSTASSACSIVTDLAFRERH